MNANNKSRGLSAADVLRRYKDEELPAFCEMLLDNVNQVGNFGERPLHVASARGKMEEIAPLIDAGADVNAPGELGNTPLHEAVSQGHIAAIEYLLKHGASPDKMNEFGETPVDIARLSNRNDLVRLLQNRSGPA